MPHYFIGVSLSMLSRQSEVDGDYRLRPERILVLPLEEISVVLQVLNIAVYRVLGEKGVYGSKLGKKVQYQM